MLLELVPFGDVAIETLVVEPEVFRRIGTTLARHVLSTCHPVPFAPSAAAPRKRESSALQHRGSPTMSAEMAT